MTSSGISPWDWAVVGAYLAAIMALTIAIGRRQRSGTDYFLAGRTMRGAPLGASILANQASAVSLIGAPAFVALREGGGLRWLQYELALPLAMLLLIAFLLPALRSVPGWSIYAYVEQRFDRATRRAVAAAFVLSRGLALGVVLYASALVVAAVTGWSVTIALVAIGLFSVAYTSVGGIVADIWSDVLQLGLLWLGTLVASIWLLQRPGVWEAIPTDRAQALVLGATPGADTFTLAPMLLGGLFLYLSYYGCDQSQAQRLLTARDDSAARRALLLNGLIRFPLVFTYCAFGLLLAGLLRVDPVFAARVAAGPPDGLVPAFVVSQLPVGLAGLMVAGILAAAMSSIDSALNSLAAVTLEDVLGRDATAVSLATGRATSLAWGSFAMLAGWICARAGAGVLETINLVGSVFYGPLLAVFTLGVLAPSTRGPHAVAGLAAGVATNLTLAFAAPQLSWLWWNPAGWLAASFVGLALAGARLRLPRLEASRGETLLLAGGFVIMLVLLAFL